MTSSYAGLPQAPTFQTYSLSFDMLAILVPSSDHATENGGLFVLSWLYIVAILVAFEAYHILTRLSLETVATMLPSGLNSASRTSSLCEVLVSMSLPSGTVVVPLVSLSTSIIMPNVTCGMKFSVALVVSTLIYVGKPKYQKSLS